MEAEPFLPPLPPTGPEAEEVKISNLSPPHSKFLSQRPLIGATLYNLGNTCFMNAVLQCITHTVPLLEKLRSNCHSPTCSDKDDDFCSFCALRSHVDECIMMSGLVVTPKSFASNLNKISSYFEPGEQQDAHEFLGYFLESIDKSFLKSNLKDLHPSSFEGRSPVNEVFRGRLKSQLQCSDCGYCSDTYEPLLDLSLEIDDVDSLTDALQSFTRKEKIDDPDAKFTCDGCKTQVYMEKQLKIDQPPTVIALHLKRFKHIGLFTRKICKFVHYPLELDLRPYMSCPKEDEQVIYDLYAIVVHNGSCCSGHYYCNIRTSPTTWHQMNDSLKVMISESIVLDQEAYILFYIKKCSFPWFASLMDAEKISQPDRGRDGSPSSVFDREDSDHTSSSGGEASCSSSRLTYRKDEGPNSLDGSSLEFSTYELREDNQASASTSPEISFDELLEYSPVIASTSPEFSTDELQAHNPTTPHRSPDHLSNISVSVSTPTGRFLTQPTKRPGSDHHIIDVFTDEPLEDDKENWIIPQNHVGSKGIKEHVGSKGSKEVGKRIKALNSAQLLPFRKQVKHMSSYPRSSILACLNKSTEPACKRPLTSKSDRPLKMRQRMTSDMHTSSGKGVPHCRSAKTNSLSPHYIKRGLFADDPDMLFEF